MGYDFMNVNKQISEHMRWAKAYAAAKESGGDTSGLFGGSTGQQQSTQQQDPFTALMSQMMGGQGGLSGMFMMMQMQMMMQMMMMNNTNTAAMLQQQSGAPVAEPSYYPNMPESLQHQMVSGVQAQANPAAEFLATLLDNESTETTDDGTVQRFSAEDTAAIKAELESGSFSVNQLGEALMRYIHRASDTYAADFTNMLGALVSDNVINPAPFATESYLSQLTPERRELLGDTLARDGLRLGGQWPNTHFLGSLLQQVNGDPESVSGQFSRDLVSRAYERYKDDPASPEFKLLTSFFTLSDIRLLEDNTLEFPS